LIGVSVAPPSRQDRAASQLPRAKITAESLREAWRLFAYLLPYRWKFAGALSCLLFSSLFGLAFPYFTGRVIDGAQRSLGEMTAGSAWPMGEFNVNSTALILLGVLAAQGICTFLHTYWLAQVGERALADMRRDTYGRLIRLPMGFFANRRVGELTSRLAADLSQIQSTLTGSIPQFLRQSILVVGGVTLITLTSGRLTIVMLSTFPILIGVAVLFGRTVRGIAREAQDKLADTNIIVEETLQGIASVKSFTNEAHETARYQSGIDAFVKAVLRGARLRGAFGAFVTFAIFGSIVLIMWYGARLVQDGQLTFGGLTQFMLYTMFVGGAVGQFAEIYAQLQQTVGSTQRVRELLSEKPEDFAKIGSSATVSEDGRNGQTQPFIGDFAFEEVSFAYPSRPEVTVLRSLSLSARPGQRIALVGPSGAGKSTIVSLLLRFYDPDSGRLVISGRDAREYPLHELRQHMAIVPQDVLLFGGTIAENIEYGPPGASQNEIEEAARKANAHQFIAGFPEAYQTIVGERGVKLSGGQRQRVAIARAILRNPAILILDEATSSLDSESESLVQQALEGLMENRTSVIVAHRLATVRKADCIYVVKDGQTVEAGTHAELVAREDGIYRNLSQLQFDLT
jgi:ABC-type multidrug transport system fused ATPase/permease subunit